MSVMEMSHRSKAYETIIQEAGSGSSRSDEYSGLFTGCLFLQGGASQQFAMIPMNLMKNKVA